VKVRRSIKPGVAKPKPGLATKKPAKQKPAVKLPVQPISVWDPRPAPLAWWP
jgi:hypothetical protein